MFEEFSGDIRDGPVLVPSRRGRFGAISALSVVEAVLGFDGTHVEELKAAAEGFASEEAEPLMAFCESETPAIRVAATWIVKALCERGEAGLLDMGRVFDRLGTETEWEALLHLLQSVQYVPGPAIPQRETIEELLNHEKTLVSVWALDALVRIALETGEGLEGARDLVETALSGPKASLRARARQLASILGL